MSDQPTATIYHNTRCSKSRETLALLQEHGVTPEIVAYLDTPPTREKLASLLDRAGLAPRQAIRTGEQVYKDLGLADADDEALLDAMVANPILIERPLVETDLGVRLGRPPANIVDILPARP